MASQTFSIAVGADDGTARKWGPAYPPDGSTDSTASTTGTFIAPARNFETTTYKTEVALLRFDTSSLPDTATVAAATLRVYINGYFTVNTRSLVAEWYDWGAAIDIADWTNTPGTTAHAGTLINSFTSPASNDLALQNLSNVSLTGYTYLRLHVDGGTPTGENYIIIDAFDHATSPEPKLIVEYAETPTLYTSIPMRVSS